MSRIGIISKMRALYKLFPKIFKKAINKLNNIFCINPTSIQFHLKNVNQNRFNKISDQYLNFDPEPGSSKYLDIKKWIPKFIHYAEELNLINSNPVNILDLGTGPGYFPLVCQNYKHKVMTLDLSDNPIYNELIELFKINRVIHKINPFEGLPTFETKFDLVTGFAICFNNHSTKYLWGINEWKFFLSDLRKNHALPGSRLFLEFNKEPGGFYFTDELYGYFIREGAAINDNTVLIPLL